jgi:methylthioribulose-1-phosphate dehydratase
MATTTNNDNTTTDNNNDHLVQSDDPNHPANLIPSLCAKFWTLGWVTGTGGGASIRDEYVRLLDDVQAPIWAPQISCP